MPKQPVLHVSNEDRAYLKQFAHSRTLPSGDTFRARLILALADGHSYEAIAQRLQTSAPTIARWKRRFEQEGAKDLHLVIEEVACE